jgi:hypothetical protein
MNAKEVLSKKSNKSISQLFKQYLMLIEDLKFEHDQQIMKLKRTIPVDFHGQIEASDFFNDAKMSWLRKRVLDIGNEALRAQDSNLEDFSVSFVFKN